MQSGSVAGTDNDANNLSIIVTALELNNNLFTIARQNVRENQDLFDAVSCDMVMNPGNIIANKIRALLAMPMLYDFLGLAYFQDEAWACELVSRISGAIVDEVPDVWEMTVNDEQAHAVLKIQQQGRGITLGDIQLNRFNRDESLNVVALLYQSHEGKILLPGNDIRLEKGDRILFCAASGVRHSMEWNLQNENVLEYILLGGNPIQSKLLRYLIK